MPDGMHLPLPHPLGLLMQPATVQRKKDTNVRRI
jgi:hypothetical protein